MNKPAGRLGAAVEAAQSTTTEEQKRRQIAQRDRAGWFGGRHASGQFGIIAQNGRVVAQSDKEADRDAILAAVRYEPKLVAMVERLLAEIKAPGASATAVACLIQDAEELLEKRT